jgi:hypothetical protein
MNIEPTTEHEHIVHALNIHGTFFERWCQHIVAQTPGWNIKHANYPVEFPTRKGSSLGETSALDIWAEFKAKDTILSLPIECKKHNPELSNWIFFGHRQTAQFRHGGSPFITDIENIPRQAPNTGWDVQLTKKGWNAVIHVCTDEARETRGSYSEYKRAGKKLDLLTKTANNAINEACQQVALATQTIINDERVRSTTLSQQNPPLPLPYSRQIFLPAIVTTARLFYCNFNAANVNVATGEIPYDKVSITEHPYLLYEYPLPRFLQHAPKDVASVFAINGWERFIRLDILVINSSALSDILSQLAVTPK